MGIKTDEKIRHLINIFIEIQTSNKKESSSAEHSESTSDTIQEEVVIT